MPLLLSTIAARLSGALVGNDVMVSAAAPVERAGPGDLSFIFDSMHRSAAEQSRAGAFVVLAGFEVPGRSCIVVKNGTLAMAAVLEVLHPVYRFEAIVSESASVSPTAAIDTSATIMSLSCVEDGATIGPETVIYPFVYVGRGARIGARCRLYPHAVVMDGAVIGDDVILQPGAVIGADGFGYVHDGSGHRKIPQVGTVIVENRVEIGANATVDRATLAETCLGAGTKLDNQVQIAHNVVLGKDCIIAAQSGIAGSSRLGNRVMIGGQAGVKDHVTIGDDVMIAGGSGVIGSLDSRARVAGFPAIEHRRWLRNLAMLDHLPELRIKIRAIMKKLGITEEP